MKLHIKKQPLWALAVTVGALTLSLASAIPGALAGPRLAPGDAGLAMSPTTQNVALGTPFNIAVNQSIEPTAPGVAGDDVLGVNTGFTFDRTKLQLNSISLGTGYQAGGPNPGATTTGTIVFGSGQSIANANLTGSVAFTVGWTAPGAGTANGVGLQAYVANFTPIGSWTGNTPIAFTTPQVWSGDVGGESTMPTGSGTLTAATVTIPAPTATPTATPVPPTPTPIPAGSSIMRINPSSQTVGQQSVFNVSVNQQTGFVTVGMQADVTFDQSKVSIQSITPGSAYTGSSITAGVAGQTLAQAIAEANTTGTLRNYTQFFLPGGSTIPANTTSPGTEAFRIAFQGKPGQSGTVNFTISNSLLVRDNGDSVIAPQLAELPGTVTINTTPATATPSPTNTPLPATATPTPQPNQRRADANVTGSIARVLNLTVPASVTIPLVPGATNTVGVPIVVQANSPWQLQVEDLKLTNKGHMTAIVGGATRALLASMKVRNLTDWPGRPDIDLETVGGTQLAVGNPGTVAVDTELLQRVENTDLLGDYGINLTYDLFGTF